LNLIHLAERGSYRLLDLYRDAGKIEKMAAEYRRAAAAFKEIDLASTQFALGTFYSVLYLGLGERSEQRKEMRWEEKGMEDLDLYLPNILCVV
jgi:hypothetical protein